MDYVPGPVLHGLSFILGLVFGSFSTAVSYRLPRGEDFVHGRSRCPSCRTDLTAIDLIPVFSWLMSGGQCRHCKVSVPWRYPTIELACAVLFLTVSMLTLLENPLQTVLLWAMVVVLLVLTVIDFEHRRLPNKLVMIVGGICILVVWTGEKPLMDATVYGVAAVVVGILIRVLGKVFFGKPGLGWGDIKLGGVLAFALPANSLIVFMLVLGLSSVILAIDYGWRRRTQGIPFGPALCAGAIAALLWAESSPNTL